MKCDNCGAEYTKNKPQCTARVALRWVALINRGRSEVTRCLLNEGHIGEHSGAITHQGREEIHIDWGNGK